MAGLKAGFTSTTLSRALVAIALLIPLGLAAGDYALQLPKAAHSLLLDIAAAGNRLVEVGERGHILYSSNAGVSWVQARVPTSVMLTRLYFANEELGWAVGHDGNVLASRDGGVTWSLQRDGVTEQARINEERRALAGEEVRNLQTELAGASGEQRERLLQSLEDAQHQVEVARQVMDEAVYPPPLMDVWFSNEEQGWAAGAFGTLLHTSNGGRFWDDWSHKVDNPDELHFNGVAGDSTGTVYLASEWGKVFRSKNGGESWDPLETGYDGSFFGVIVNPVTDHVFAYGLRGTVYRSVDRGESWRELESQTSNSLFGAASTNQGLLVFVGQDGTAISTSDDGDHFMSLQQDSTRGFYGVAAMRNGRLMVTGDGGNTELVMPPIRPR